MIPFLLACALNPAGADLAPAIPKTIELRFRTQRSFALALPAESWSDLGQSLPTAIDGHPGYALSLEGGNLRVDTDGDGELDVIVEGKEGFVILCDTEGAAVSAVRLRCGV